MESRCSLIRGNVTDKTWASRYMSSPAIQQLLLPAFIVSLLQESQPPHRARPRRPAPTIIKIELSLIESSRFSPTFGVLSVRSVWMSSYTHTTFCSPLPHFRSSSILQSPESAAKNRPSMIFKKKYPFGEVIHFPRSLFFLIKWRFAPPGKLLTYNSWWIGKILSMFLQPVCCTSPSIKACKSHCGVQAESLQCLQWTGGVDLRWGVTLLSATGLINKARDPRWDIPSATP